MQIHTTWLFIMISPVVSPMSRWHLARTCFKINAIDSQAGASATTHKDTTLTGAVLSWMESQHMVYNTDEHCWAWAIYMNYVIKHVAISILQCGMVDEYMCIFFTQCSLIRIFDRSI